MLVGGSGYQEGVGLVLLDELDRDRLILLALLVLLLLLLIRLLDVLYALGHHLELLGLRKLHRHRHGLAQV